MHLWTANSKPAEPILTQNGDYVAFASLDRDERAYLADVVHTWSKRLETSKNNLIGAHT